MQQGLLGRISRTSIMEYHAFGIISEGRKSGHHYMICGVQGDFTKKLVAKPPKTLWTRELKFGTSPSSRSQFLCSRNLTNLSRRWARLCNVQAWDSCLYGHGHWRRALYMHSVAQLVPYLDWIRPRANFWPHDHGSRIQTYSGRAHDIMGFEEKRGKTEFCGTSQRSMA